MAASIATKTLNTLASKTCRNVLNVTNTTVSNATTQIAMGILNHNHAHFPITTHHTSSLMHHHLNNFDIATETHHYYDHKLSEMEHTCALIKPESVKMGYQHAIIDRIKNEGFNIVEINKIHLSNDKAQEFYADHKEKKFFGDLVDYMTSGPIYALDLEKHDGIQSWRNLMGPTDANLARHVAPDSLRAQFGTSKEMNAVHGSDSKLNAKRELGILFR